VKIRKGIQIVLLGAPGSGKGTQGRLIAEAIHVQHFSLGDALREHIAHKTSIGQKVHGQMQTGALVCDELVNQVMAEEIGDAIGDLGFVLDGYPRTISQASHLDEILDARNVVLDLAIALELDDETILKRNIGRRHCSKCGRDYNTYFDPPKISEVCNDCQCPLARRKDCQEGIIERRLRDYTRKTKKLTLYYESQGVLVRVNGLASKRDVHLTLVEAVRQRLLES